MNKTAKKRIDALTQNELLVYRTDLSNCKTRDEQLIKAGKMICDMWILHWTSDDAEYLLKRAGVRLLYK